MLAAWRRTSVKLSVPERMGITMSDAAVSITITSLTDIISFMIGVNGPFVSIQIFCIYSCMAVCFIFIWHITFFAACMALSGYCEEKNLHSIFGYKVKPVSVAIKGNSNRFLTIRNAIDQKLVSFWFIKKKNRLILKWILVIWTQKVL